MSTHTSLISILFTGVILTHEYINIFYLKYVFKFFKAEQWKFNSLEFYKIRMK